LDLHWILAKLRATLRFRNWYLRDSIATDRTRVWRRRRIVLNAEISRVCLGCIKGTCHRWSFDGLWYWDELEGFNEYSRL